MKHTTSVRDAYKADLVHVRILLWSAKNKSKTGNGLMSIWGEGKINNNSKWLSVKIQCFCIIEILERLKLQNSHLSSSDCPSLIICVIINITVKQPFWTWKQKEVQSQIIIHTQPRYFNLKRQRTHVMNLSSIIIDFCHTLNDHELDPQATTKHDWITNIYHK